MFIVPPSVNENAPESSAALMNVTLSGITDKMKLNEIKCHRNFSEDK